MNPTKDISSSNSKPSTSPLKSKKPSSHPKSKQNISPSTSKNSTVSPQIDRPHKCEDCAKSFISKEKLLIHYRIHTGERPFECHICQRCFIRNDKLKLHMHKHNGTKVVKSFCCPDCGKVFATRQYFKAHIEKHDEEKLECKICNEQFSCSTSLIRHSEEHITVIIKKCQICGTMCTSIENYTAHMREVHSKDKKKYHKCLFCGTKFEYKYQMMEHFREHSNESLFECRYCYLLVKNQQELTGHVEKKHIAKDNSSKCLHCGKICRKKAKLEEHIREHNDKELYSCFICQMKFEFLRDVGRHTASEHFTIPKEYC